MYKDLTSLTTENTNSSAIDNSIKNILLTKRGSVPGNPRFGSDLYSLIFNQLDTLTESVAKSMIFSSLTEFEDRIQLTNIEIKSIAEYNKLVITIEYIYKDNFNDNTTSVFSFSLT